MPTFHHRKLPNYSTLLSGRIPKDEFGFESLEIQVWYNNTEESWVKTPEQLHCHTSSDEMFIVLRGKLIVKIEDETIEVKEREFCCFPKGIYHAILEVYPPTETFMIRGPSIDDKVY